MDTTERLNELQASFGTGLLLMYYHLRGMVYLKWNEGCKYIDTVVFFVGFRGTLDIVNRCALKLS